MKTAFVFPGQGSQYVGMGRELWHAYEAVKSLYREADSILGYDLSRLSFEGPQDELNKTWKTQPAVLTASIAAFNVLTKEGILPFCVAGHSLGEYSAVVAAGILPFQDVLRIVEKRGRLMQEAVPEGNGLMAAVLGMGREKITEICNTISGVVSPANYNCPGQIVISGERNAVEEAMETARKEGSKKTIPLAVSVPSHCPLMESASHALAKDFESLPFQDPSLCIINNADAKVLTSGSEVKTSLIRQLSLPLLWEDSIQKMIEMGADCFIEVGPGKVLSGLIRKIDRNKKIFHVDDNKSLSTTIETLRS